MISIKKATAADFPAVLPLVRKLGIADEDIWKNLFQDFWERPEDHFGLILLDDETVVGLV